MALIRYPTISSASLFFSPQRERIFNTVVKKIEDNRWDSLMIYDRKEIEWGDG